MSKRFIITEQEKNDIKKLYNLNEGFLDDTLDYLKKTDVGKAVKDFVQDTFGTTDITQILNKGKEEFKDITSSEEEKLEKDLTDAKLKDLTYGNEDKYSGDLTHTFSGQEARNIDLLVDAMNDFGITDPMTQIGILSVIGKESGFIPKSETSYANTGNSRIRRIFGSRVPDNDEELDKLKKDPKSFFNKVYSKTVGNGLDGTNDDDGYKYRGRGFNQLTGEKNYEKYGNLIGKNLVGDPDEVNDARTAADVAIMFFTKGKKTGFPKFNTKKDASEHFADINAGSPSSSHRANAVKYSDKFDIK